MSFRAQEWAYSLRDLSGPEKAVLLCLAWHHNGKTGLCCPGNQLLADETGLGLSTVKKALASLKAKNLITAYPWKRGSAYMLAIVGLVKAPREPRQYKQEKNLKEGRGATARSSEDPPSRPDKALAIAHLEALREEPVPKLSLLALRTVQAPTWPGQCTSRPFRDPGASSPSAGHGTGTSAHFRHGSRSLAGTT